MNTLWLGKKRDGGKYVLATVCVCVLKYIERLFACLQPVLAVRLNSPCVNIVPLFTDV